MRSWIILASREENYGGQYMADIGTQMEKGSRQTIESSDIIAGISILAENEFMSHGLNPRQCQVAHWLFKGDSANSIAKRLYITPSCVRYHISKIYEKTRTRNRGDFLNMIWRGIHISDMRWSREDMAHLQEERIARNEIWEDGSLTK